MNSPQHRNISELEWWEYFLIVPALCVLIGAILKELIIAITDRK